MRQRNTPGSNSPNKNKPMSLNSNQTRRFSEGKTKAKILDAAYLGNQGVKINITAENLSYRDKLISIQIKINMIIVEFIQSRHKYRHQGRKPLL